jgi:type VI protein secretion system component Hcp
MCLMKKLRLLALLAGLLLTSGFLSAQNVQIYASITGINGPVASVPGLSATNLFPVGCAEHQMQRPPGSGLADHLPLVITKPIDPASSPFLRQALSAGGSFTRVELFYLQDNGGSFQHIFTVRIDGAVLTQVTTGADSNGLQENFHFTYSAIYWADPIGGTTRGWDLINNVPL